jgi:hypothetical protein
MIELLGKIALSSSWTGTVNNGQIRIIEEKIQETKTFLVNCK